MIDGGVLFKETLAAGTYSASTIPYMPIGDQAVAVDASGDIFVSTVDGDQGGAEAGDYLYEAIPAFGGGYNLEILTPETWAMGLPFGIAVASNGDLYLSAGGIRVLQVVPDANYRYSLNQTLVEDQDFKYSAGIAADAEGNVYVADNRNNLVVKDTPTNGDFGAVGVGSSATATLIFDLLAAEPPSITPAVLTAGAAGLDFTDLGTGTCNTTGPYFHGTCTVNVKFTPKFAGARNGAVMLNVGYGAGYVYGTGSAPQVDFLPGTRTTVGSVTNPVSIAVDAGHNLYAVSSSGTVFEESFAGGSYTQSTLVTGVIQPGQIAVDAGGTVFIAEGANGGTPGKIVQLAYFDGSLIPALTGTGGPVLVSPSGIAIDGAEDLYIADSGQVIKEALSYAGFNGATILTGGSADTTQIAVDPGGNLYIAGWIPGDVVKETLSNGSYVQSIVASGLSSPSAVSVDAAGNVYIADTGNNRVLMESPSGSTYTQIVLVTGLNNPIGLTLDETGNLYIADSSNNRVLKLDYADPPSLSFATTPYLSTSTDSPQNVTLENIGNLPLSFPVPASGSNPNISSSFDLETASPSACPSVTANSASAGILDAGSSCELSVSFVPATVGNITGALVVTDTATLPGSSTSQQTIQLNGTGTPATPPITWSNPAPITYGTRLGAAQLDAMSTVPGTFNYSPAAGAVLTAGLQLLTANFAPTDSIDYTAATATVNLTVNQAVPKISLSPSAATITTAQNLTLNVTVQNQASGLAPTGAVTLTSGSYTAPIAALTTGNATIEITAGSLPLGSDELTVSYSGDTNFSAASAMTAVTVTPSAPPAFSVSGTSVTITAGAITGNTSTITVTPAGGFTGSVALAAVLASTPYGAINIPTLSFGSTSPVAIPGPNSGTATLAISTLAPGPAMCSAEGIPPSRFPWAPAGGAVLAGVLLFRVPRRRRSWKTILGMLVFLTSACSGILACGNNGTCPNVVTPGTSPGTYTVTVTGTSGSITSAATITVVVQ